MVVALLERAALFVSYRLQEDIANTVIELARKAKFDDTKLLSDASGATSPFENEHLEHLSQGQRAAVALARSAPVMVLTGGPGCGKTFATDAIVQQWDDLDKKAGLCAPTGADHRRCVMACGWPLLLYRTRHLVLTAILEMLSVAMRAMLPSCVLA